MVLWWAAPVSRPKDFHRASRAACQGLTADLSRVSNGHRNAGPLAWCKTAPNSYITECPKHVFSAAALRLNWRVPRPMQTVIIVIHLMVVLAHRSAAVLLAEALRAARLGMGVRQQLSSPAAATANVLTRTTVHSRRAMFFVTSLALTLLAILEPGADLGARQTSHLRRRRALAGRGAAGRKRARSSPRRSIRTEDSRRSRAEPATPAGARTVLEFAVKTRSFQRQSRLPERAAYSSALLR